MPRTGQQLYLASRALTTLRLSTHPAVRRLSLRQKLAIYRVQRRSKMTRLGGRIYTNTFSPPWPSLAHDRFLEVLVATGTGSPRPGLVNFAVTARCPCRCWHCSFSNRGVRGELSREALVDAIGQVQALGAAMIGFTGGEPLLRPDLEELVAAVGERSTPLLFTTGAGLTRERAHALASAGLVMPVVSMDSDDPAVHDEGRGVPGMHAKAVRAIELFLEEGLYTSVSFVPTRALLSRPEAFWRTLGFIRDLGVHDMRLTSPILSGKLTGRPEQALAPEHVALIREAQARLTRTPGEPGCFAYDVFESAEAFGCGAGYNYLFVDSRGNLCPCDFTMMSFGNLRERPVAEVWRELSGRFCQPGCSCYATRIAHQVAATGATEWPLDPRASLAIHEAVPSAEAELPAFHRGMGFRRAD